MPNSVGISPNSLPSCCRLITDKDKPDAIWIDFWAVTPSGDADSDYERGARLGDEAFQYACDLGQPAWLDCIVTWMNYALRSEGKELGPLEHGFLHCVLKKDPELADRLLTTFYGTYPQLRN
jgi:hypothetical protein